MGSALGSGPMAKRCLPVNGSHGKGARMRQFSRHRRPQGQNQRGQGIRFWGRHAVLAALANPERRVKRIWGTREALSQLDLPPVVTISYADVAALARPVARDAPHLGLVIEVDPLAGLFHGDILRAAGGAGGKRRSNSVDKAWKDVVEEEEGSIG